MNRFPLRVMAIAACTAIAVLAGCSDSKGAPAVAAAAGAPPEVGVVTISAQNLPLAAELPGRVNPVRVAEVRARAAGIVLKQTFEQGSDVKTGQLLFRIDPAPLQAAFDSAKASVDKADAALAQARLQEARYRELVPVQAVSKQDYDNAVIAVKSSEAMLAAAKAAAQTAQLNLNYTAVTSPISGRVGKAQVTEGALVGQGDATLMATVTQTDPIYVDVTQSSADILRLRRALQAGKLKHVDGAIKVNLTLEDGSVYPQTGKLLFSDITVDQTSGMVTLRAQFPNPNNDLLPGMYVRAKVSQAVQDNALTVPQMGVQRTPGGAASVMLVNAEGKVEARPVVADTAVGNVWVVTSGLKPGDKVIVSGLQKVKPGVAVTASEATASAPAAATAVAAK